MWTCGLIIWSLLYNCVLYHLICIYDQLCAANYLLYISFCCTGLKYLLAVPFFWSKTIEPAVQLVLNDQTNKPVNRWSHRFDVWFYVFNVGTHTNHIHIKSSVSNNMAIKTYQVQRCKKGFTISTKSNMHQSNIKKIFYI